MSDIKLSDYVNEYYNLFIMKSRIKNAKAKRVLRVVDLMHITIILLALLLWISYPNESILSDVGFLTLLITMFSYYSFYLAKVQIYHEAKIMEMNKLLGCNYKKLDDIKSVWIKNKFGADTSEYLKIVKNLDYYIDISQRYGALKGHIKDSIFYFFYNAEAKNRILGLLGVLISLVSLLILRFSVNENPDIVFELIKSISDNPYSFNWAILFIIFVILFFFIMLSALFISARNPLINLLENISVKLNPDRRETDLSSHKCRYLMIELIRNVPVSAMKNN